jgi:XTP/dITP diphosphohydrolase
MRAGGLSYAMKLLVASSNPGKVSEYEALAQALGASRRVQLAAMSALESLAPFVEEAPTFAENAAGKALHYSRLVEEAVIADDSGLCVAALDGGPGVHSARYAGPGANDAKRIEKLLADLQARRATTPEARRAHFACVLALARQGRVVAIVSARADGIILEAPQGTGGFGYDPVFFFPPLGKTFAELGGEEKNQHSHRGKAFRRLLEAL